ncbi:hypothetical protein [Nitratireductor rhodophyticola]|uniref:hypothetical protein n=1 Tax=Nitratireductor rhodophyticola TaxID=2854036 RepID=UPI00300B7311
MIGASLLYKALFLKLRQALGPVLLLLALAVGIYFYGHHNGKEVVFQRLQSNRITILKDGKAIDVEVLRADDATLCDKLGGCLPDGGDH